MAVAVRTRVVIPAAVAILEAVIQAATTKAT
jgi:hypothetical protein